jgi:hypothetical protein
MDYEGLEATKLQLTEFLNFYLTKRCKVFETVPYQYLDLKFYKEHITLYAKQDS